jgi:hypothetical protein
LIPLFTHLSFRWTVPLMGFLPWQEHIRIVIKNTLSIICQLQISHLCLLKQVLPPSSPKGILRCYIPWKARARCWFYTGFFAKNRKWTVCLPRIQRRKLCYFTEYSEWNRALLQNTPSYIKLRTYLYCTYLQNTQSETVRIHRIRRMKLRIHSHQTHKTVHIRQICEVDLYLNISRNLELKLKSFKGAVSNPGGQNLFKPRDLMRAYL